MNAMKPLRNIPTILLTLILLASCGFTEAKPSAEMAIEYFHDLYNHAQIDQVWSDADPEFRDVSRREMYEELLRAMQKKLGKVVSTSNSKWNVQAINLGTIVSMTQNTVFEHGE